MFELHTLAILLLIALGAMVQTLTGFAMGLIIMGGVTAFGLAGISETAAVVSLISLLNTGIALRSTYRYLDWRFIRYAAVTLVPALVLGVYALHWLSDGYYRQLKALLGVFIVGAGTLLMLKPVLYETTSRPWVVRLIGFFAGLMGGMYSAGGAPLAYIMYRQPLDVRIVRASLLAMFAISTAGRSVIVAVNGEFTTDVLTLAVVAMPLVIVVTMLSSKFAQLVPDQAIRKMAFGLLILLGSFLVGSLFL